MVVNYVLEIEADDTSRVPAKRKTNLAISFSKKFYNVYCIHDMATSAKKI